MKLFVVCGARPNFIKIASLLAAIDNHNSRSDDSRKIDYVLVHTGQHYDKQMSENFFADLDLPKPHVNLGVGSASHAEQTAEIMKRFEPLVIEQRPDVVLVVGDVNSTIACSLVASKIHYPDAGRSCSGSQPNRGSRPLIAHVEAGLRSFDRSMPEEINRILTDALSDFLFTSEPSANHNLEKEGIPGEKIFFVGNTMIDTLLKHRAKCRKSPILERLGLARNEPGGPANGAVRPYGVVTLHRPSNVDDPQTFGGIVAALCEIANRLPLIFPVHPRTMGRIREYGFENNFKLAKDRFPEVPEGIYAIEPLGYIDFMQLMSNSRLILTDSGGMQEESTILGIPCITLRENTERPCTLEYGNNCLVRIEKDQIINAALSQIEKLQRGAGFGDIGSTVEKSKNMRPPLWDGLAGERTIKILVEKVMGSRQ